MGKRIVPCFGILCDFAGIQIFFQLCKFFGFQANLTLIIFDQILVIFNIFLRRLAALICCDMVAGIVVSSGNDAVCSLGRVFQILKLLFPFGYDVVKLLFVQLGQSLIQFGNRIVTAEGFFIP